MANRDGWKRSKALVKDLGSHTLLCFFPIDSYPARHSFLPPSPTRVGALSPPSRDWHLKGKFVWSPEIKAVPAPSSTVAVLGGRPLPSPAAAAGIGSVPLGGGAPLHTVGCRSVGVRAPPHWNRPFLEAFCSHQWLLLSRIHVSSPLGTHTPDIHVLPTAS